MSEETPVWTVSAEAQAAEVVSSMQPSVQAITVFWHMLRAGKVPRIVAAACTVVFCWKMYDTAGSKSGNA